MIKLERILCPTDLSEDSERTIRYAVAITRASGARLFVCHRPKSPSDREEALATIQKLITAGLTSPSGISYDPSTVQWESVLLDGSDLGTIITREAESRRADLIFMRSRRRPFAAALLGSTAEAVSRLAARDCMGGPGNEYPISSGCPPASGSSACRNSLMVQRETCRAVWPALRRDIGLCPEQRSISSRWARTDPVLVYILYSVQM
jgi:nucleotide-binding universal stress UspA family protein